MTGSSHIPVAIVTGAAQGIGEATARLLVQRGYAVVLSTATPKNSSEPSVDSTKSARCELLRMFRLQKI